MPDPALDPTAAPRAGDTRPAPARRGHDRRLIRHLALNAAVGVAFGWLCAGAILAFTDLGPLFLSGPDAPLAVIMLFFGFAITWGSAAMGTAIFLLPKDDSEPDGGKRAFDRLSVDAEARALFGPRRASAPIPVRVRK